MPRRRKKGKTCIDTRSPFNKTVFYERDRRIKEEKHPELRTEQFISQVKQAINRPWRVYRSPINPRTLVFYDKIGEVEIPLTPALRFRYAKVVIAVKRHQVNRVLTAFGVNYIRERQQVNIKRQ